MTSRKTFLKTSAITGAAMLLNSLHIDAKAEKRERKNKQVNKPIVLSTWNFGLKANEAAWEILSKGGKA